MTHQNSVETENRCISDGVFKNSPCPRLLKQNVLAILQVQTKLTNVSEHKKQYAEFGEKKIKINKKNALT